MDIFEIFFEKIMVLLELLKVYEYFFLDGLQKFMNIFIKLAYKLLDRESEKDNGKI